jgi:hypothetical protein
MWFWVALGSGLLIQVLYLLFVVIMGLSGNLDANL